MTYIPAQNRYETMPYRRCGKSGLLLPAISLGLWHNFGNITPFSTQQEILRTAFDHGITHFDLANNYGPPYGEAERNFGMHMDRDWRPHRDELILSTKAGYDMWKGPYGNWGSKKYLMASLDQSLKRMHVEYVDIFYHHRMDPNTPLEESMMALDTAVKSGKALYAGISRYDLEHTRQAMEILKELKCPFIIHQTRYSIFDRHIETDGVKSFTAQNGCGIIAFSPLAQGLLTDKYLKGIPEDSRIKTDGRFLHADQLTPEKLAQITALNELAKNRGQTLAQMALSWVLRDGEVTSVLIGASKPEQILENLEIVGHTSFTEEELRAIDAISPAE